MKDGKVEVLAELGGLTVIPRTLKHVDLTPALRIAGAGPVLDHSRLDLADLSVSLVQTTRVSLSMIAQTTTSRPIPGLSYAQGCTLAREHLIAAGAQELADLEISEENFTHGELAALLRAPWLFGFPSHVRTYDVASGKVKLLPGDEVYSRHLTQVLALREVLTGEALEAGVQRVIQMRLKEIFPVRASTVSKLSMPLRLLLAARGEDAVLDLLFRSDALSHAADDAVGLIREDLAEQGPACLRLQSVAGTLVRNPSRRPALVSSGVCDLRLVPGGALLLLPDSPESLACMERGEPHLFSDENTFRDARARTQVQSLSVGQGLLNVRFSRIRLQEGTVHHDDQVLTLEREAFGRHKLSTLNLMKPGRKAKVRTVVKSWDVFQHLGRPFTELNNAERSTYLYDPSDDLPF